MSEERVRRGYLDLLRGAFEHARVMVAHDLHAVFVGGTPAGEQVSSLTLIVGERCAKAQMVHRRQIRTFNARMQSMSLVGYFRRRYAQNRRYDADNPEQPDRECGRRVLGAVPLG